MNTNHVRSACTRQTLSLYRLWFKVSKCGVSSPKMQPLIHGRHLSIFQDFSKRLKGEMQSNPELQKSMEELKKQARDWRHRTKESSERIYKRVEAMREDAKTRAKQVSTLVKETILEAADRVSKATMQVRESIWNLKLRKTEEKEKTYPGERASDLGLSATPVHGGAHRKPHPSTEKTEQLSDPGGSDASSKTQESFANRILRGFSGLSLPDPFTFLKFKNIKLTDRLKDSYHFIVEELTNPSSRRRIKAEKTPATTERNSSTAVVPAVRKTSGWEKRWENLKEKARSHPMYRRLKGVKQHPVMTKGQEVAEDFRERWETSDSPMVQKIQDLNDSLFGETASAAALKEIRNRDPEFSFPEFVLEVQENIRPVLHAYLKGDLSKLKKLCTREVIDRCIAERNAYESQGIFFDNKILHVSDVEVKETKLLGNVPIIIVTFNTQQVYCVRDRKGNIMQGAKDDIQTVYYAWAMQQVSTEDMEDGEFHPYWQLREMQQLGIKAII